MSLLGHCPDKTVLFGAVFNGGDSVETPEHVCERLLAAADHLPPERIQVAPDCGLVVLSSALARKKLHAVVRGAQLARERVGR